MALKLVAAIGIHGGVIERSQAAALLWPDVSEAKASANLRTLLWRSADTLDSIVESESSRLRMLPHCTVDLDELDMWWARVVADVAPTLSASELDRAQSVFEGAAHKPTSAPAGTTNGCRSGGNACANGRCSGGTRSPGCSGPAPSGRVDPPPRPSGPFGTTRRIRGTPHDRESRG